MKTKTIDIPIYFGKLILIKAKDFKKTNEKFKVNISKKHGAATFINKKSEEFECIVSMVDDNVSLVAHEAIHVCNAIYKKIGAKLNVKNDEHQAYLVGWIVDEIETFLKEIQ